MKPRPGEAARLLPAHELFRLLSELLAADPLHRLRHGIAVLDVDGLQELNLAYGRFAGDRVLACVANSLALTLQRDEQGAHWAGDQFVVLFAGASRREALARTRQITLITADEGADTVPRFSVSAGVATYPFDGTSNGDLVDAAHVALQRAKSNGRRRVSTPRHRWHRSALGRVGVTPAYIDSPTASRASARDSYSRKKRSTPWWPW